MRVRYSESEIIKTSVGNHDVFSGQNITASAGGHIHESCDGEIIYGEPEDAPIVDMEKFAMKIFNGYFYTIDGLYLGKIGVGNNVYITNEAFFLEVQKGKNADDKILFFTDDYNLDNSQLLDRANWIFGEGRGEFADDYAHTIQNIKNWGPWGQGYKNESDMYKSMTDGKYSGKNDFFSGNTGYSTYDDFAKARKDLLNLNKLKKGNLVIKAVLDQQTGVTQDQTPNATQWLGYPNKLSKNEIKNGEKKTQADKSYDRTVKKYGKDKVLRRDGSESGRSHIFYDTRPTDRVKQLENKKKK
ncbi:MAG: hypothetical protein RSF34_09770 [Flavobacterium sp.]|uniref:hypothetical protein n=1 Tax=Flavobacterium sp. TaxID=239 RepID=UPI002FCBA02F